MLRELDPTEDRAHASRTLAQLRALSEPSEGSLSAPSLALRVEPMRWLLGTLLSTQRAQPHVAAPTSGRSGPVSLFGDAQPQLALEEYTALAGIWRAELELDDGDVSTSLHLAAPRRAQDGGNVYPMEEELPFNICQGSSDGWTRARWFCERKVRAGAEGDNKLSMSLQLGNLYLEGRGERSGLRCTSFVGTAFEGGEDPCVVGRFMMRLALPIASNVTSLEQRYRRRIATRPPPPLTFARPGFVGGWRLLLSVDDDLPPASFPVELAPDGSWQSSDALGQILGGTWGMHSRGPQAHSGSVQPAGSSVWLTVLASRCTETLAGVGGLPVRSDFHLSGKPVFETVEQELAARAASDEDAAGGAGGGGAATADRVDGRCWVGSHERAYFGRFSLVRLCPATEVQDVPCDMPSREEEAKRAWLQKLESPLWGEAARRNAAPTGAPAGAPAAQTMEAAASEQVAASTAWTTDEQYVGAMRAVLSEECHSGDATACDTLQVSREQEAEAKRAWLAKINHDAPTPALEAAAPDDQAKQRWLEKLDAPSWGPWGPGQADGRA